MLSRRNDGALSIVLQKVEENEEEDDGGVVMAFSGKAFQIPPVGAFSESVSLKAEIVPIGGARVSTLELY